jgi:SP family galactose:H+ symporter-like MFS transporter
MIHHVTVAAPEFPSSPEVERATVTPWLGVVLAVILLSGALFGYDQGVISGALAGIKANFLLRAC